MRGTDNLINDDGDILVKRILGERNEARFGEYPWMLGIIHDNSYKCGGSLIHPQVVLTAAHCVTSRGSYKVRAGEYNWDNVKEPLPHQDSKVKKVTPRGNYLKTNK